MKYSSWWLLPVSTVVFACLSTQGACPVGYARDNSGNCVELSGEGEGEGEARRAGLSLLERAVLGSTLGQLEEAVGWYLRAREAPQAVGSCGRWPGRCATWG